VAPSGAALVLSASAVGVGAYSYLKPTTPQSAPMTAVPITTMADNATDSGQATGTDAPIYQIESSASQASFTINEVLRGSPKTVIGTTNQISGQIAFDVDDPSTAQVGTILIDARTLATDDTSRNRAIDNQILDTNQYEYISFTPTQISGLPDSVTLGQPFTLQMTGDLTIRDTMRPVTFEVTVTPNADGSLTGTANTAIPYSDWGITIPNVPFVASVDNQVVLQLDFYATAMA
jgi:polyisoprenoid-binding protein YceI